MSNLEKRYVGEGLDRVDGKLKVTGRAKYAAEFSAPGMTYAVLVQSEIAKGKVLRVDISKAEAASGVLAVITPNNLPPISTPKSPPAGQSVALFQDEVLFAGQNMAVVVGESLEQAQFGADLVDIEYSPEKPESKLEPQLGNAEDPPKGSRNPVSKRGDVDEGLASATHKLDQVYRTPLEHHNPMEPHATVAIWGSDGTLVAYDATQGVFNSRNCIAQVLNVDNSRVRVIDPFVGGGFGSKGQSWPHASIAAVAAMVVKRPVKLAITRRQMFTSNGHRPETRQALTLGTDQAGRLVGIRAEMANSTSRKDSFLEPTGLDSALTYSCPNVFVRHRLVRLDTPAPTYMRAPGESSGSFSIETAMDELAVELGMDPIELRLANYAATDESQGRPFSSKSLKECYVQGAEAFGWSHRNPKVGSMTKGRTLIGYGMATATYPANFREAKAKATLRRDGSILVETGTQDLGTGTYTILTQVAADAAGVSPERVVVHIADTSLPESPGSGGSTSAASAGSAVHNATIALKNAIFEFAASQVGGPLYGISADDLQVQDGIVSPKRDPDKRISYQDLLKSFGQTEIAATASAAPGPERGAKGEKGYTMQGFGAQFCEVHVDRDLGMLRVARWVGAYALGTTLNKKTLTSQLQGGIIFGIGMGLLEETMMDPRYGRMVNTNLAEYHVPVHMDIPDMTVIIVPEKDDLVNPIGVKGGGEIGITGAAAAIGNAVYHATGKRIRDLPITLDKLL